VCADFFFSQFARFTCTKEFDFRRWAAEDGSLLPLAESCCSLASFCLTCHVFIPQMIWLPSGSSRFFFLLFLLEASWYLFLTRPSPSSFPIAKLLKPGGLSKSATSAWTSFSCAKWLFCAGCVRSLSFFDASPPQPMRRSPLRSAVTFSPFCRAIPHKRFFLSPSPV